MKTSLDRLIVSATDDELCRAVIYGLIDKYGNEIDAKKFPKEVRVVILTDHARGIIGNGGFRYLFEGDFPGDPGFRLTVQAFDTLGVTPAVTAFKKALAVFPNSRPPKDIDKRLQIFLSMPYSRRQKIDEKFWNADDEITKKLAQYIRAHSNAFIRMKLRVTVRRRSGSKR